MSNQCNHIFIEKDCECCGCKNCVNICPKKAIKMVKNEEGFYYPKIDKKKCINCGLCTKVCPLLNDVKDSQFLTNPICYGITNINANILTKSTSGGFFNALAKYVLSNEGYVVGASYDENMKVKHIIINTENELERIMGSKYVYSDLNDIFIKVKELLQNSKNVLFTGVPCQVAALKVFLKKEYQNLITMDVICHGTPNQDVFDKYKKYLEERYKAKLIDYKFRSKKFANWGTFKALASFEKDNKKIKFEKSINADFDRYYMSFLNAENYRESCYTCKYANLKRISDFTVGDFWGIEKINKKFTKNNGVSALIVNTVKGEKIFNELKNQFQSIDVNYKDIYDNNGQLRKPSMRKKIRDTWYKNFDNKDFFKSIKIKRNPKRYLKLIVPSKFKMLIKRIIR